MKEVKIVIMICMAFLAGCVAPLKYSLPEIENVKALSFTIEDLRPAWQKVTQKGSSFRGSCDAFINRYGDESMSPSRIDSLANYLEIHNSDYLKGKVVKVHNFTTYFNQQQALRDMFGGGLAGALAGGGECQLEDKHPGGFVLKELDPNYDYDKFSNYKKSGLINHISVEIDGKFYSHRSVSEFEPKPTEAMLAAFSGISLKISKQNADLALVTDCTRLESAVKENPEEEFLSEILPNYCQA